MDKQTKPQWIVWVAVGLLGIICVLLAIAGELRPPHVKSVEYVRSERLIRVLFDRPVDQVSVEEAISIAPALDYRVFWNSQSLNIQLDKPLVSMEEYSVS